ncbi:CYTH domain-containing protein [Kibdelosporangium aridum]|uniref:CYTH domain-containing protein n=1 Tax=Kibdelosporangium aridum TaxID=2030 RepID=UPI0035EF7599
MRTQREVERKYEAAPDADLPELAGATAEPRHETLDAVYYDTEDLRLIRGGLTLRRREGGEDEGWHLKVPVGEDTRDEIHLPLNGKEKTTQAVHGSDARVHPWRGTAARRPDHH